MRTGSESRRQVARRHTNRRSDVCTLMLMEQSQYAEDGKADHVGQLPVQLMSPRSNHFDVCVEVNNTALGSDASISGLAHFELYCTTAPHGLASGSALLALRMASC